MSDKPIAVIVTTLIAAPLVVVCCAIGPAAILALAGGTITGTIMALMGEIALSSMIVLASLLAFFSLIFWNWWRKNKNPRAELEDTCER